MQKQSDPNDNTKRPVAKSTAKSKLNTKLNTIRINLTSPRGLLEEVDKAAAQDYASRSDIIRQSLLWYLRPQGRDLASTDPDQIVKAINQRKGRAELRKFLKENADEIDVYDG